MRFFFFQIGVRRAPTRHHEAEAGEHDDAERDPGEPPRQAAHALLLFALRFRCGGDFRRRESGHQARHGIGRDLIAGGDEIGVALAFRERQHRFVVGGGGLHFRHLVGAAHRGERGHAVSAERLLLVAQIRSLRARRGGTLGPHQFGGRCIERGIHGEAFERAALRSARGAHIGLEVCIGKAACCFRLHIANRVVADGRGPGSRCAHIYAGFSEQTEHAAARRRCIVALQISVGFFGGIETIPSRHIEREGAVR